MSAFRRSVKSLARLSGAQGSAAEAAFSDLIDEHLRLNMRHRASPAERRSWERSIPALVGDLMDAGLDDLEVLIEYQLPLTSKRADAVLAGVSRRTGRECYVVVELKQWSHAELFEDDQNLVLVDNMPGGPQLHPLVQVKQYCEYMADYLAVLEQDPESISGIAYLHNASERDVSDLHQLTSISGTRLFTQSRRADLLEFLKGHFAAVPGTAAADLLLKSRVRPSKQLMAIAADQVKNREHFVLLDEQKLAFELVRHTAEKARRGDHKEVIVVTGGPGSGKSAIALSLLGEFSAQNRPVVHATGSQSFTETMRKVVGKGSTRLKSLFKYFNNFANAERNDLDVLICDEAHRIRATSTHRFMRPEQRTGRPQIDELIAAARVPVFLLDEHQVVRPEEVGTVADIEAHANSLGLQVRRVDLDAQFRCGGSRKYEMWVHSLLGLDGEPPEPWTGDDNFDVTVAGSPSGMEHRLRQKLEEGYGARMAAGFCWPWTPPQADNTLVPDVQIGAWQKPWNVKSKDNRHVGDAPPSVLWSTADGGFEQVGCIYTAQGFEYDWNGVIIGPDLVARNGRLITQRNESRDREIRKRSVSDADADRHIRNAYKVLLTRGMMGTVLFAVDEETQVFLNELICLD